MLRAFDSTMPRYSKMKHQIVRQSPSKENMDKEAVYVLVLNSLDIGEEILSAPPYTYASIPAQCQVRSFSLISNMILVTVMKTFWHCREPWEMVGSVLIFSS